MSRYQKKQAIEFSAIDNRALRQLLDADDETIVKVFRAYGEFALALADRVDRRQPDEISVNNDGMNWGQRNLLDNMLDTLIEQSQNAHRRYDLNAKNRTASRDREHDDPTQEAPSAETAPDEEIPFCNDFTEEQKQYISLFESGLARKLSAEEKTDLCDLLSQYGWKNICKVMARCPDVKNLSAPVAYARKGLQRESSKRTTDFTQRPYTDDTPEMDRMMTTYEHGFPERVYPDETNEIVNHIMNEW